jgi:hypothetical protein
MKIEFETISDMTLFFHSVSVTPEIALRPTKHMNMKDEYSHDVTGFYRMHGQKHTFKVNESFFYKEKIKTIEINKMGS